MITSRPRLLVVDDDRAILTLVGTIALAEGFDVAATTIDSAVEVVKLGARDYLTKPFDLRRLRQLLASVRDEADERRTVLTLEGDLAQRLEFCGMIGGGPAMQEVFGLMRRIAPHVRTALITGETGTGKELAARALHRLGPRTLDRVRGNKAVAARLLGISRRAFYRQLERHGLHARAAAGDQIGAAQGAGESAA